MLLVGLLAASTVSAQTNVMRIEEDWELEITQPDTKLDAPQVLVTVSPFSATSSFYFEVDINHASYPAYDSGGLQIRAMDSGNCLSQKRLLAGTRLSTDADIVRWTNVVEKQSSGVAFGVANGDSTSWGKFGDSTSYVTIQGSRDFAYDPTTSFNKSGVSYASNRVKRLTLCRVRYIDSAGKVTEVAIDQSKQ
ncbi:MAG: hypothetical protein ACTHK7_22405 [Aureliella sp.]